MGALVARELGLVLKNPDGLLNLFKDVREDFQLVGPSALGREHLQPSGVGYALGLYLQLGLVVYRGVELFDPLVCGAAPLPAPLQPQFLHVFGLARVQRLHLLRPVEEVGSRESALLRDGHHVGVDVRGALVEVQDGLGADAAVALVTEELRRLPYPSLQTLRVHLAVSADEILVRGRKQQLDRLNRVAAGLAAVLVDYLADAVACVAVVADEHAV